MPKKQQPTAPPAAVPDGEPNRYLAKIKASLCKRWSYSRMETLYEIADLAVYLWALDRPGEAVEVATAVAAAIPAPPPLPGGGVNYNLWCPATHSHALVSRLSDRTRRKHAAASLAALIADTGVARDNPEFVAGSVKEARRVLAAPPEPRAMKWECQSLARAVGEMTLYAELGNAGDVVFAPHVGEAIAVVQPLLTRLGAKLRSD